IVFLSRRLVGSRSSRRTSGPRRPSLEETVKISRDLICVLLCASTIAAAEAKPSSLTRSDDLVLHNPSRAVLPSRVGLFQRSDVEAFDKAGRDIGVSYDLDHLIK